MTTMTCPSTAYLPPRNLCASLAIVLAIGASRTTTVAACPFCTVESRTLTEEINSSDAVVLAKLLAAAPPMDMAAEDGGGFGPGDPDSGKATFEVVDVVRGQDHVAAGDEIQVVYFGEDERDKLFFIVGIGTDAIEWTTPLPLTPTAVEYVRQLPGVAPTGADRLTFFQEYLENDDPLLAQDAYDEFARAPYSEVKELKDRMQHDRLVKWIASPEVNPSRRRLYLTMLGVCGDDRDLPLLKEMITADFKAKKPFMEGLVTCGLTLGGPIGLPAWIESVELDQRRQKLGLDAMIACYLTLRGPDGMDLIDQRFLKDPDVEYSHGYSTIMALRFLGEETDIVPRGRLLESMRLLLDNPNFADQVILDLSRWEDWSALDRLVQMFKASDAKSYVRQPVVTYLTVASEQPGEVGARATAALEELEALDPEAVKRARSLMAFGYLARARASSGSAGATRPATGDASDGDREQNSANVDLAAAGFAATAEDLAAAENVDADDFPDPAAFADASATPTAAAADAPNAAQPTAKANVASPPDVAAYSRPLVIGVPLAAAALLVAVYWLILRIGVV
jgi:hypothetical protein